MNILINSFLFGLAVLFLIRLYVSSKRFALIINKIFLWIEKTHHKFNSIPSKSLKILLFILYGVTFLSILLSLFQGGELTVLAIAVIILIPGIPIYLEAVAYQQKTVVERLIESIKKGNISISEIIGLKKAIKEYYLKQNMPKPDEGKISKLLASLIKIIIILINPKCWLELLIPKITAFPIFSSFFYYSPFHARFHKFTSLCELVEKVAGTRKFRLFIKKVLVCNEYFIIEFRNTKKHAKSRAKVLASKIEKEYGLIEGSILLQENEKLIRFFIPAESLN